mmetsp:Transcript_1674/g.4607  ORF Transcript_1674/g.4607 Transcript_1674/m.4607 type:complete len:93 (-) Transcript_1674:23-301(-)
MPTTGTEICTISTCAPMPMRFVDCFSVILFSISRLNCSLLLKHFLQILLTTSIYKIYTTPKVYKHMFVPRIGYVFWTSSNSKKELVGSFLLE